MVLTDKMSSQNAPAVLPQIVHAVNLKLVALGCAPVECDSEESFNEIARAIVNRSGGPAGRTAAPVDRRIQEFLDRYLGAGETKLPLETLTLDRAGLARALSIPFNGDEFFSKIISSYRVRQGVLHNPRSDRRTTQGIFHVAEGGLLIPDDKLGVPKEVFAKMLNLAFLPPRESLRLPFTSNQSRPSEVFVSLLLRPIVCPEVRGFTKQKTMEVRFFAPGSLVSNLDFVETIFGNGGDPGLPENDAGLDIEHWCGTTGCVVLAPHLVNFTKKELGLPRHEDATERQRRDGMCWKDENEKYNNGNAFKLTCRDASGVMVTLIADNYFGYCKKEVKTQISYSANLMGLSEEEHAGGALVYASYDLGEEFSGELHVKARGHSFREVKEKYRPILEVKPEGCAVDRHHPDIIYVPEDVAFNLLKQTVSWTENGQPRTIRLLADKTYVRPSGYKVHMEKVPGTRTWRLIGTVADGLLCHKPCTVSGGGKSEISKPISDAIIHGPVFVADFQRDFDQVQALIERDYSGRFRKEALKKDDRTILSHERSLGSVIKLFTPSKADYTDEYNEWLNSIPQYIKELVFVVKRFYHSDWGSQWRERFSVDTINGTPGNELKLENRKLVANYLRVGYETDGSWRTFGLRNDFHPAGKISMEDDISASVIVPERVLNSADGSSLRSLKFVINCENRLFQRPDDAVHRGYDKQTEQDFAKGGNFFSNYEPLAVNDAKALLQDAIGFDQFTPPMQDLVRQAAHDHRHRYFVSSAHPRVIDGKPSKNPRYLQLRPDLANPREKYLAEIASRLQRRLGLNEPLYHPVDAVVPGRRNNPPEPTARIRPLAVYNPIHFMELPGLFMEFICSMTGKSPSTTGAGSEGALTKGPFNALSGIYDLNAALVSYLLTEDSGFVTAAGYVGPKMRVDHDVSLLIPEIWSRMTEDERDPKSLIASGYLEKCEDFEHNGKPVLASRLGYRITQEFVIHFFGRVFNHPHVVFTPEMLKPELQDMAVFVDGMDNIVETQKIVASHYFDDGSVEHACPPLKALLHIMRDGNHEGKDLRHPEIRALFTKENLLGSEWYRARLEARHRVEKAIWKRHTATVETQLAERPDLDHEQILILKDRLEMARAELKRVESPDHLRDLQGTIGTEPVLAPAAG